VPQSSVCLSQVVPNIIRSIRNVAPSLDDAELILAARADEAWAREALVRRHLDGLYGFAFRLLGAHSGAREIVEFTFVESFATLTQLKDPSAWVPWMFRVAVRAARTRLEPPLWRRWPRRAKRPDFSGFRGRLVLASAEEQQSVTAFYECLETLPLESRFALLLRELEEMDTQAVAYAMRATAPAVRRWSLHAERKLRPLGSIARPPAVLYRDSGRLPVPLSEFERAHLHRRIEAGLSGRGAARVWRRALPAAAALLLPCAALLAVVQHRAHAATPTTGATSTDAPNRVIELPDGSRLSLSPSAELRVDALDSEHIRLTLVSGRADFEIAYGGAHFVIGAGDAQITALGRRLSVGIEPSESGGEPASIEVRATDGPADVQRGAGAPITLGSGESWSARQTVVLAKTRNSAG
jgi:ferric-dicitrate binding protein FerR (iron transport regulator)